MDLRVKLCQHIGKTGIQSARRILKCARQQRRDFFHSNLTCVFARLRAAHAIANCKGEIVFVRRGFTKFSEPVNFARVKAQTKKRILVVLANLANVRTAGPF